MKLHQFYQLDEMEQIEVVWSAEKVASRLSETGFPLELLKIGELYVEVKVHLETGRLA